MKNEIFPFEMINHNVEALHARHHQTTRIIYLTVLLLLIGGFTATFFIKINVSTQSRGVLRTESANNSLQVAVSGQILQLDLSENQQVRQGDTLLTISTAEIDEQIRFQEEQLAKNKTLVNDLNQLLQTDRDQVPKLQSALFQQGYLEYQQQLNELELKIVFAEKNAQRSQQLQASGNIARVEAEQQQFELELAKNAYDLLEKQQRKNWQIERQRYQNQQREFSSTINRLAEQKSKYVITAPITGTITQFSGIQTGNFILPNQQIATISADDGLIVESYVSPADIGLIQPDMEVKFQVDAFNYNQWGLATGKVVDISRDITTVQEQPFFIVRCSVNEQHLRLKNGYAGNFKKGMTLTARYSITERTVFQLLYDTVDDWLDPNLS